MNIMIFSVFYSCKQFLLLVCYFRLFVSLRRIYRRLINVISRPINETALVSLAASHLNDFLKVRDPARKLLILRFQVNVFNV